MSRSASRLLVVDVQEKLVPFVRDSARLIWNCRRLIEGAQLFSIPVTATEQYPQGLGPTVPALQTLLPERPAKTLFSCGELLAEQDESPAPSDRFQYVVCGIEAHVCVLQTALDLIAQGFRVFIPADAISSRGQLDQEIALQRLTGAGAVLTTTESVLFEWCERSGTPEFKQISRLVKESAP